MRKSLVICATQLAGGVLLKKLKYFEVISNIHEFCRVRETAESRLVYVNKFPWNAQSYFLTEEVVIIWSLLAGMKSCPVLQGSWQFRDSGIPDSRTLHKLWVHVKSFILVWKNPKKYISIDRRYFFCIFTTHMMSIYEKKKQMSL